MNLILLTTINLTEISQGAFPVVNGAERKKLTLASG
jgi:hypothetical protein